MEGEESIEATMKKKRLHLHFLFLNVIPAPAKFFLFFITQLHKSFFSLIMFPPLEVWK